MYVQWKGLNQGTSTIKQGSCKITIKSNSVTVTGWFMTELTRQRKRDKGQRKRYILYLSETELDRKSETQRRKERKGEICCKTFDLILLILQHWQNPRLPHLLSFCHVIVISFPTVSKDPGTFQLSLIWQMSNNFAFNLCPAGAKYARQKTDATVISEMVDCWWFWNWILTHPNSLSSLECQNGVGLRLHFSSSETCLFWKVNKAQETLHPGQQNLTGREMFLQRALQLLIIRAQFNYTFILLFHFVHVFVSEREQGREAGGQGDWVNQKLYWPERVSLYTLLFNNIHIHFLPFSLSCKLVFSLDLQHRGEIIIMLLQLKPRCFGNHVWTLISHSSNFCTLRLPVTASVSHLSKWLVRWNSEQKINLII